MFIAYLKSSGVKTPEDYQFTMTENQNKIKKRFSGKLIDR
jgi:hypothetical protein